MAALKKLPPACVAPLRLHAVTLHGIGSYYHPGRLEIRPLTILCGTNGSGKSTWIKVLTLLQECAREESFPWNLHGHATKHGWRLLNAKCAPAYEPWPDDVDASLAGPPGTMALEFDCVRTMDTPATPTSDALDETPGVPEAIRTGTFKRGDHVVIRMTPPAREAEDKEISICDCTLLVNGLGIAVRGQVSDAEEGTAFTVKETDGRLHFSVLPEAACARYATLRAVVATRVRQLVSAWAKGYFHIGPIRDILDEDASVPEGEALASRRRQIERDRWVGANGEHTHAMRAIFAFNPVLDPRANRPYTTVPATTKPEACHAYWPGLCYPIVWRLVATRHLQVWRALVDALVDKHAVKLPAYTPLLDFAARLADADHSGDMADLAAFFRTPAVGIGGWVDEVHTRGMNTTPHCFCQWTAKSIWPRSRLDVGTIYDYPLGLPAENHPQHAFLETLPRFVGSQGEDECIPSPTFHQDAGKDFSAGESGADARRQRYAAAMEDLGAAVKAVMEDPLFLREYVDAVDQGDWPGKQAGAPPFLRFLARLPADKLPLEDREWCIDWILTRCAGELDYTTGRSLRMGNIVNAWMRQLIGTSTHITECQVNLPDGKGPHVGYLSSFVQEDYHDPFDAQQNNISNCFMDNARPVDMSAGFHQIAPILVQTGVMKMNELLAVENPEAHLHPKLQLRFMECLIENAMIGKFLLIETHSDLMVRRTLRAIMEETLPQSWVNIHFSHVAKVAGTEDTWTSRIERLRLENGRVVNWPEGFLDDDENETQALMKVIYGGRLTEEGVCDE
jgi:hypothetical protein